MSWDKQFRKYVWDDEKTPYLTSVANLNRRQASNEIYIYTLFIGTLFCVIALLANTGALPHGRSFGVALYAFTIVCATVVLAFTRSYLAAWYCGLAPVATLLYFFVLGFRPDSTTVDHVVILVFAALWLHYSWRIIRIGKRFEDMPEPDPEPPDDR